MKNEITKKYTVFERSLVFTIGVIVGASGAWVYLLGKIFTNSL